MKYDRRVFLTGGTVQYTIVPHSEVYCHMWLQISSTAVSITNAMQESYKMNPKYFQINYLCLISEEYISWILVGFTQYLSI
jgi:hypothetical protein